VGCYFWTLSALFQDQDVGPHYELRNSVVQNTLAPTCFVSRSYSHAARCFRQACKIMHKLRLQNTMNMYTFERLCGLYNLCQQIRQQGKVKVKLSLCLTKHHAIKMKSLCLTKHHTMNMKLFLYLTKHHAMKMFSLCLTTYHAMKTKLSLCLTKHHAMKTFWKGWGWEI
jgi:hypothetical protein